MRSKPKHRIASRRFISSSLLSYTKKNHRLRERLSQRNAVGHNNKGRLLRATRVWTTVKTVGSCNAHLCAESDNFSVKKKATINTVWREFSHNGLPLNSVNILYPLVKSKIVICLLANVLNARPDRVLIKLWSNGEVTIFVFFNSIIWHQLLEHA